MGTNLKKNKPKLKLGKEEEQGEIKSVAIQVQKVFKTPNRTDQNKFSPYHTIVKTLNMHKKDTEIGKGKTPSPLQRQNHQNS
jgi:hypothetical protein